MDTNFKQVIDQIQQAQLVKLAQEKITYNKSLVEVEIAKLIRPSYSTRIIIDNRLSVLQDNLTQFGFLGGIFVHKQNHHVIDGWHRVEIWEQMGHTTIPCYLIQSNNHQERQLHLRLNHQVAAFDLSSFDLSFPDFNLLNYGFSADELNTQGSDLSTYQSFQKRAAPDGFVKLQTLVSKEAYQKLKEKRAVFGVNSVPEVIERLAFTA